MKSKQVLSVEQMKHLQELGLSTSDGSMCFEWNESDADKERIDYLNSLNTLLQSAIKDLEYDLGMSY